MTIRFFTCVQNDKDFGLSNSDAIDATRNNTLFRRFAPYAVVQNDKSLGLSDSSLRSE